MKAVKIKTGRSYGTAKALIVINLCLHFYVFLDQKKLKMSSVAMVHNFLVKKFRCVHSAVNSNV